MPRIVTCQIIDQPDGRFAVVATMPPDRVHRRDDLDTLAEAEAWIEGLRVLMAACGAPVVARVGNVAAARRGGRKQDRPAAPGSEQDHERSTAGGETDGHDPGPPPRI